MARNPSSPVAGRAAALVAKIDALKTELDAQLADYVAEEKALAPSIPEEVHKNLLLRNGTNYFGEMRRLMIERGDTQERVAQQRHIAGVGR